MRFAYATILTVALASLAAACSASVSSGSGSGGFARVSVDGRSYEVRDVSITIEPGENAWFRIEGEPATRPNEDYVPGLRGGLGLYGDLPASVRGIADLAGKRLRIDFTGDDDDANFIYDENGEGPLKAASSSGIAILRRES